MEIMQLIPLLGGFFLLGTSIGKWLGERSTSNIYETELRRVWRQKSNLWKKIKELI